MARELGSGPRVMIVAKQGGVAAAVMRILPSHEYKSHYHVA